MGLWKQGWKGFFAKIPTLNPIDDLYGYLP